MSRKIEYIITCDRCGKTWKVEKFSEAIYGLSVRMINGIESDLCSTCVEDYDNWMNEVQERWLNDGKAD